MDANTSAFPGMWDVAQPFTQASAARRRFSSSMSQRTRCSPFGVAGTEGLGRGTVPRVAYIGGWGTLRGTDAQRYAGDASLYGTGEIRIPVARIRHVVPIDLGVLAFTDAGRVYVNGSSPGGWHVAAGGGLWFGVFDQATGFSVILHDIGREACVVRHWASHLGRLNERQHVLRERVGPLPVHCVSRVRVDLRSLCRNHCRERIRLCRRRERVLVPSKHEDRNTHRVRGRADRGLGSWRNARWCSYAPMAPSLSHCLRP